MHEASTLRHPAVTPGYLRRGTRDFWRAILSLFLAGLATFALLYGTQPLLPIFSAQFAVSPALASLSLSVATGTLALTLVIAGSLSEAWGRTRIMTASLVISSLLQIVVAVSPSYGFLLVVRAIQGVTLAGLPASAMAYLSEEIDPGCFGLAMGLLISGNTIGGLTGRVVVGVLTDALGWRAALAAIAGLSILVSVVFWRNLPRSAHFHARPLALQPLLASLRKHLADPGLPWLFLLAALLTGSFVSVYNYIGYRLLGAPYDLSQAVIGWIFALYLVGTASSTLMGRLADRITRRKLLWFSLALMLAGITLTLVQPLGLVILGIAILTFGFFGAHSMLSSWVGKRALTAKAQATALYLLCYYLGSSVIGSIGGIAYTHGAWPGVVAMVTGLLVLALLAAGRLVMVPPIDQTLREGYAPILPGPAT